MQMVQSLTELRKILLHYSRKKDFQSPLKQNLIETDILEVTLNHATKKYFPFRKANNTSLYISDLSNHPPTIFEQSPKMISNRISDLSCNKEKFDKVKSVYETELYWTFFIIVL